MTHLRILHYIPVCVLSTFRSLLPLLLTYNNIKSDTYGYDLCMIRGIKIFIALNKLNTQYCSLYIYIIICIMNYYVLYIINYYCGPGSSVGIATDYGLDGPGSYPGGDEIFRPSRPALGPTQPPVQRVPCLYRG